MTMFRMILLFTFAAAISIPLLFWWGIESDKAVNAKCAADGGRILSRETTGVGVGVGGQGSVVVVPTVTTVSFCVTPDGRILW